MRTLNSRKIISWKLGKEDGILKMRRKRKRKTELTKGMNHRIKNHKHEKRA